MISQRIYSVGIYLFTSIFVLFLFTWQYKFAIEFFTKHDPALHLLPIILAYLVCFVRYHWKNITFDRSIILFIGFALWLWLSYAWVPDSNYPAAKTIRFLVYVLPTFWVSAIIIAPSEKYLTAFINSFLAFYGVILALTMVAYWQAPASLPCLFGTNYLRTGQTIGLGTVILGAKLFDTKFGQVCNKSNLLIIIVISIAIFLELHLGGRGPLLNTLLVLGGLIALLLKDNPKKLLLIGLLGISSIILGIYLMKCTDCDKLPLSLQRIFSSDGIVAFTDRLKYYKSAWQCFLEHPITGIGIGGWPEYYGIDNILNDMQWSAMIDSRGMKTIDWHPHNIFLEIAAEAGAIGLSLFIGLLVMLTKNTRARLQNNGSATVILCGLGFCFLNALKTGDLNDNIVFFTFLGLIAGFAAKKQWKA